MKDKATSFEAQVAQMEQLLRLKDNDLDILLKEVAEKDMLLQGKNDLLDKLEKEVKKEKKVKKICCFPTSLVIFSLVIFLVCWCYPLVSSVK